MRRQKQRNRKRIKRGVLNKQKRRATEGRVSLMMWKRTKTEK
jgi:hypothetical protein